MDAKVQKRKRKLPPPPLNNVNVIKNDTRIWSAAQMRALLTPSIIPNFPNSIPNQDFSSIGLYFIPIFAAEFQGNEAPAWLPPVSVNIWP